jgi:hypothetical protein
MSTALLPRKALVLLCLCTSGVFSKCCAMCRVLPAVFRYFLFNGLVSFRTSANFLKRWSMVDGTRLPLHA